MGSGARSLAIATRSLKERGFWVLEVLEVLVFVGRFGLCRLDFALSGMGSGMGSGIESGSLEGSSQSRD